MIEYEGNFPRASPMLYVLLALNGQNDTFISLVVNETLQPLFLGKTLDDSLPVLPGSAEKVGGHADIERAVRAVRHDIDPSVTHDGMLERVDGRGWP
jgi:hypothetical protein